MTRKHFKALAQFAGSNNLDDDLIVELADVCKSFNGKFDRNRFFDEVIAQRTQLDREKLR
tara:strand:- start:76 stop:255 length:180 start_codon:yes stop_codon:yes gene_type:complete